MKKYKVTLYYHSSLMQEVEAKNEKEAIEMAIDKSFSQENIETILDSLIEDDTPDVEEIK